MTSDAARLDYRIIAGIIEPGSKVLDLGCGNGELIAYLEREKKARVQGIELDEDAIYKCVEKGLSVLHSDIDRGLKNYPDKSFNYVILNQSLQEIKKISYVIDESLRVGEKAVIGFPNFANLWARSMLFLRGKVPITRSLPYKWHDTPNLRFLSINDFEDFCREKHLKVLKRYFLGRERLVNFLPNLFALNAIFVVTK